MSTAHPLTYLPLGQALDETGAACAELRWMLRHGKTPTSEQNGELAEQLRALAERLETHGGAG